MVRRKNCVVLGVILALVALIFFSGPASSAEKNVQTRGISDSEIRLGGTGALSGPLGIYSVYLKSIDAYFKMINDQGGINGRKIKYYMEDDAYQTAKTIAKARKLVEQDQIFAAVGVFGGPPNLAIKDYMAQHQVPMFPCTGIGELTNPPKKHIFSAFTTYDGEGAADVKYAVDDLKLKKIAVAYNNNDAAKTAYTAAKAQMAKFGLSFVSEMATETGGVDYSGEALKLKQAGAELVLIYHDLKGTGVMLNEMGKIGYKPKVVLWGAGTSQQLFGLAGQNIDGVIVSDFRRKFEPGKNPQDAKVSQTLKKYYPNEEWEKMGQWLAIGWSTAEIAAEGLKRGGKNLTLDSFIAGMETLKNFKTTFLAPVTYTPNRRQGQNALIFQKADYKTKTFVSISDWVSVD